MKTLFGKEILCFKKLDRPLKMIEPGEKLKEMVFTGQVDGKHIYWDKHGKCANPFFNDFFVDPYNLIDYYLCQ